MKIIIYTAFLVLYSTAYGQATYADSLFKANKVKRVTIFTPSYTTNKDTVNTHQSIRKVADCYFDSIYYKPVKIIIYAPIHKEFIECVHVPAYKLIDNQWKLIADTAYMYHPIEPVKKEVYIFKNTVDEVAQEDKIYYNTYIGLYKYYYEELKSTANGRFYTYADVKGLIRSKTSIYYKKSVYGSTTYFNYEFYE